MLRCARGRWYYRTNLKSKFISEELKSLGRTNVNSESGLLGTYAELIQHVDAKPNPFYSFKHYLHANSLAKFKARNEIMLGHPDWESIPRRAKRPLLFCRNVRYPPHPCAVFHDLRQKVMLTSSGSRSRTLARRTLPIDAISEINSSTRRSRTSSDTRSAWRSRSHRASGVQGAGRSAGRTRMRTIEIILLLAYSRTGISRWWRNTMSSHSNLMMALSVL
jgi:hypothetical protein